jgi:hypothetical protein
VKSRKLSNLFTEGMLARLLKEEEDDSLSHEIGASGDSLDAQVDRYLAEYETDSKQSDQASVDQMESLDWNDLVKGRLILEAGEDADATDVEPDAPAQPDSSDDSNKLGTEAINVETFANDVVRLIQNYDSLLEVRSTLIRRAKKFLEKTYNGEVVEAFESTLRDDHGMEAGSGPGDVANSKFTAPAADRANGSAAPGGSAGGPV